MPEYQGEERRLVKRLINYWEHIRGDDKLPEIHKFDGSSMPDIWENCCKLSLMPSKTKKIYKYDFVGRRISQAYGKDPTGQQVSSNIRSVPGTSILTKVDKCVDEHRPVMEQGQFINEKDKIVKYRSCILPFGKLDDTVTHIVLGLSWRVF